MMGESHSIKLHSREFSGIFIYIIIYILVYIFICYDYIILITSPFLREKKKHVKSLNTKCMTSKLGNYF